MMWSPLFNMKVIKSFVGFLNEAKTSLHPDPIFISGERDNIQVEIALQWTTAYSANILSFVNNINTIEGGTHVSGLKTALTRSVNNYAVARKLLKVDKGESISGDDIREGLTCVLSVKIPEPQFVGQTKTKLGNSEVRGMVESILGDMLAAFLDENPGVSRNIILKRSMPPELVKARKAVNCLDERVLWKGETSPVN